MPRFGAPRAWIVALFVAVQSGLLAYSAVVHSPVVDEPAHLAAGLAHWHLGRYDMYRVNPPLVRMVATMPVLAMRPKLSWARYQAHPVSRIEFLLGEDFIAANRGDFQRYFIAARWMLIPVVVFGGLVCYWWATELGGQIAGITALVLWCFNPDILTHGAYITPDACAASVGAVAGYATWKWMRIWSWDYAWLTGLAMGMALLTKMTWLVLFVATPLIGLASITMIGVERPSRMRAALFQLFLVFFIAIATINAFYCFDGTLTPLRDYRFVSKALSGLDAPPPAFKADNLARGSFWGILPIPFPREFVLGLDLQQRDFDAKNWSYLAGVWRRGGWWCYYLVGMAVKMPVAFWLLVIAAPFAAVADRRQGFWYHHLAVLLPGILVIAAASLKTGMNQHFRYVLPAYPFIFVWIGWMVGRLAGSLPYSRWSNRSTLLCLASVAAYALESLLVFPHSAGFANAIAGGPEDGHAWLSHSATDWGQDLFFLKRWCHDHPDARPLYVSYYHVIDPRTIGLDFQSPPFDAKYSLLADASAADYVGPRPGWYAVSVNDLVDRTRKYDYLKTAEAVERVGASIAIFHLPEGNAWRTGEPKDATNSLPH